LYKDNKNDFIVIENKCSIEYLWKKMDVLGFERMKCYLLMDEPEDRLINYFKLCYLSTNKYEIFTSNISKLKYNTTVNDRHKIINVLTKNTHKYLEIGIEYGYTFSNTHFLHKVGVDPDPKCDTNIAGSEIFDCTSDYYFDNISNSTNCIENLKQCAFDVVFIDGMHHCENVLRDFNNSINKLTKNGFIFIDDCIPLNYNEQLKIPTKHFYEKGILKYGEEWTGDVWKFLYHLLKNYKDNIQFHYFHNVNYRGIGMLQIKEKFTVDVSYEELNNYNYFEHFNDYLLLLSTK
jgi:hypothetical protein